MSYWLEHNYALECRCMLFTRLGGHDTNTKCLRQDFFLLPVRPFWRKLGEDARKFGDGGILMDTHIGDKKVTINYSFKEQLSRWFLILNSRQWYTATHNY